MEIPELLIDHQDTIRALDPAVQTIGYSEHHWRRWFEADDDLEYVLVNYPERLSRGDVSIVVRTACDDKSGLWIRRLFFAVMLWGFGEVAYGAYRTSKMLQPSDSLNVLRRTVDLTCTGDVVAAYNMPILPYCGPTFRTKYLYFVGMGFQLEPFSIVGFPSPIDLPDRKHQRPVIPLPLLPTPSKMLSVISLPSGEPGANGNMAAHEIVAK